MGVGGGEGLGETLLWVWGGVRKEGGILLWGGIHVLRGGVDMELGILLWGGVQGGDLMGAGAGGGGEERHTFSA